MSKVIVFTDANYADEFDVQGFEIIEKDRWDRLLSIAEEYFNSENAEPLELYFGTNEMIYFEDFRDVQDFFNIKEITDEECQVIEKCFGKYYGICMFERVADLLIDNEEE